MRKSAVAPAWTSEPGQPPTTTTGARHSSASAPCSSNVASSWLEPLTAEVGKPISQSINELNALKARLDFFISHAPAEIADELGAGERAEGLEERIGHEPLGVVANISAWNYPYFVGANVFVPALLTGNAVLYKPSEYATLTGLAIARALHDAGVPGTRSSRSSAPAPPAAS